MVLGGRVRPSHNYHGFTHTARYEELADGLLFCARVVVDTRTDHQGILRHPKGYVAWTQNWGGEVYRVDFDLEADGGGEVIAIVTGVKQ